MMSRATGIRAVGIRMGASIMLALVSSGVSFISHATEESFSPYVDKGGNISSPQDFRSTMVHLGSWFVPDGGASGFHDVYTEKETVEVFRKTGKFPDGATLVKELRASTTADYSTGSGVSHANQNVKQWFVMIKDADNRFSGNTLWGDGWGWALFKPGSSNKNVATDYKKDCLGCHVPAKEKDWVYTEAYPTLVSK